MSKTFVWFASLLLICSVAMAADKVASDKPDQAKKAPKEPVIVVLKTGERIELNSVEIGTEEDGLLGKTFRKFRKLPVQLEKLKLEIPVENLARIEVVKISADGKQMSLKMTAVDGKAIEGVLYAESKIIWRGTHPFAESEAMLDVATISEVILKQPKP